MGQVCKAHFQPNTLETLLFVPPHRTELVVTEKEEEVENAKPSLKP